MSVTKEDAMTYEPQYNVQAIKGTADRQGLTLYEASKALKEAKKEGKLCDASRISRTTGGRDRFVGFFCEWTQTVRPAFQAFDQERSVLLAWGS
jgi:hypothetical protein